MGEEDAAMKTFLSNPYVFADVFNYWLHDGAPIIEPEDLREASESLISFTSQRKDNTRPMDELAEKETKKLKSNEKTRDMVKHWICKEDGRSIYAIMAIEAQNDVDYSMVARAMIYDSRQYEKQIAEISDRNKEAMKRKEIEWSVRKFLKEDRLVPVITLVVYMGKTAWDGPRSLHDLLLIQDPQLLTYAADYKLNLIEPWGIDEAELDRFRSSMREVMLYIKASEQGDYLEQLAIERRFRNISLDAKRLINVVTGSNLTMDEEEEEKAKKKGEFDVCKAILEISEKGRNEGINIGRTEGISIGRTEGINEGINIGQGKAVFTYMRKNQCDLDTAMEFFEIGQSEREGIIRYMEANQ